MNVTRFYPCEDFENKDVIVQATITSYNQTAQTVTGTGTSNLTVDKSYKAIINEACNYAHYF